jgi:hypothetical protein
MISCHYLFLEKAYQNQPSEMPWLKASSAIQNNTEERGLPNFTPLWQLKKLVFLPLRNMESLAECKIVCIKVQNF